MRIALFGIALVVIAIGVEPAVTEAQSAGIAPGAAAYIEKMNASFEKDFREEITRQNVPIKLVTSREEAQIIIVGEQVDDTKITPLGPGSMSMRFRSDGVVTVRDKANNTELWSGKWEVRSLNPKDQRKAASNLVGKLKKAVRRSR